jgi:hypothetical protein
MKVDCPASFRLAGERVPGGAIVKNLSGGGLLMWIDRPLAAGDSVDIVITPHSPITPPLAARLEAIRCHEIPDGEGTFAVACRIREILPTSSEAA